MWKGESERDVKLNQLLLSVMNRTLLASHWIWMNIGAPEYASIYFQTADAVSPFQLALMLELPTLRKLPPVKQCMQIIQPMKTTVHRLESYSLRLDNQIRIPVRYTLPYSISVWNADHLIWLNFNSMQFDWYSSSVSLLSVWIKNRSVDLKYERTRKIFYLAEIFIALTYGNNT